MKRPDAIVLDFDGVVLASTGIKTEAFREIFSRYPAVADVALDHHVRHRGTSRRETFRFLVSLLGSQDEPLVERLSAEFGALVEERIAACPFVDGADRFLSEWSAHLPLYVASTAPPEELARIVDRRGLGRYFRRVLASLDPKALLLKEILDDGFDAASVLFIGDSLSDLEAAVEAGVEFWAIGADPVFAGVPTFADMAAVSAALARLPATRGA